MTAVIIRRFLRLIIVLIGVSLMTFFMLKLTGDPVTVMLPESTEADRAVLREAMGFNEPLPIQLYYHFKRMVQGDFGVSYFHHKTPAMKLVLERMPTTILLTLLAMTLAIVISVPAGIMSAVRRYSLLDNIVTVIVFLGQSMPVFWTGIMLMLLFAVRFRLLPVSGWGGWEFMVLPAFTLGMYQTPLILRLVRSSMLEVLSLDYIRTARAKGLVERMVVYKHALKNAAIPVVTVIGLQFGALLGGAVITETVFAIPGLGRLIVRAIGQLDFPIVQAGVFVLCLIVVTVNFLVDMLYIFLNPQVRIH
ncbi:MAG: ABC transporter permease [Candidatus Tectomicrobia bacterium]|nr:ABC transporter permease [Candidatus Tectomicrobia bacterium]